MDIYPAEEVSVQEDIEVVEEGQTIKEQAKRSSFDTSSVLPLLRALEQQPRPDTAAVQRQRHHTASSVHTV